MENNENIYTPKPVKTSPYADSPYVCAFEEAPAQTVAEETAQEKTVEATPIAPKRRRNVLKPIGAIALAVALCTGTALGVSSVWKDRFARMEAAMEDRFDALAQLYAESQQKQETTQKPTMQGPLTPDAVYAKNVQAVVTVHCLYKNDKNEQFESFGSGFIISADGYVVTNYHVIQDAKQVNVVTNNEKNMKALVVGYDATNDVALLKVDGSNMPYVTLGSSDSLVVGDQVAAIGNPLGELSNSLTVGYISAKDRVVDADGTVINMLQTDAAINAGNSGGPLFNMKGEVVGIITAKFSGSSNSGASIEGLGFAIPIDDVSGILSDLKEYGYVTGAYLGVYVRDVDASGQSYGLPAGAYVEEVIKGYCAEKAGIRAGDIIVNLGGYDVDSMNSLLRALRRFKAGDSTSVTVFRGGQKVYLTVTLDEKTAEQQENTPQQNQNQMPDFGNFDDWFDYFFGIN